MYSVYVYIYINDIYDAKDFARAVLVEEEPFLIGEEDTRTDFNTPLTSRHHLYKREPSAPFLPGHRTAILFFLLLLFIFTKGFFYFCFFINVFNIRLWTQ